MILYKNTIYCTFLILILNLLVKYLNKNVYVIDQITYFQYKINAYIFHIFGFNIKIILILDTK